MINTYIGRDNYATMKKKIKPVVPDFKSINIYTYDLNKEQIFDINQVVIARNKNFDRVTEIQEEATKYMKEN